MASRSILSCVRNQTIRNSLLKSNGAYLVASMSTSAAKQLQVKHYFNLFITIILFIILINFF